MDKWDKEEKEQPKTEITYLGSCYHSMKKGRCIYCNKTEQEIKDGVYR